MKRLTVERPVDRRDEIHFVDVRRGDVCAIARRHRVKGMVVWSLMMRADAWDCHFYGVVGSLREAAQAVAEYWDFEEEEE